MNKQLDELTLAHQMLQADYDELAREKNRVLENFDKAQLNATNAAVAWQRTVKELQERILELEIALKTIAEIATGGDE